jgi:hydrophobic/amphiphilic exporter-1 (mainly G- bacteria), HAE1 family
MYKFAINRPITTLMMVVTLLFFGMVSFKSMPVSLFPNIDFPMVTVKTAYYGADPETIESKITDKIEEAVSSIDGIDLVTSSSSDGMSIVIINFLMDKDINHATNDVRDKISAIILPRDAEKPVVSKLDVGGAAVLGLFVAAKDATPTELMTFVDKKVKPKIERLKGVGGMNMIGYRDRQIRIYPDLYALNKYGITLSELNGIIANENLKRGGGKIVNSSSEIIVKTEADAKSVEAFSQIHIRSNIRLSDLARVEDGLEDIRSYSTLNGNSGVIVEIQKISGANTLDIINRVKEILPEVEKLAGDKYELVTMNDTSGFIQASVDNVKHDLLFGSILAIIIVFIFLRNLTATLVSALAIPTSIIGTFAFMQYLGYDLNKLTLIGLTLAIGIFIDDAIVVIENIYKKLETGMSSFEASFEGIKEISFSILAISAMLLAVFIPVAFMDGIVGQFFNSFAMTVASGIVISYFVAIMLIPMVSARVLRRGESRFYHMTEPVFVLIDKAYVALIRFVLRFKYLVVIATFAGLMASGSLGSAVGFDFVPKEDKSEIQVTIKGELGSSLEKMKGMTEQLVQTLKKDNNIIYVSNTIGFNTAKEIHKAQLYVKLVDIKDRTISQGEIISQYRKIFSNIPGYFVTVGDIPNIKGAGANVPYQLLLQGDSLVELNEVATKLKSLLATKEGIVDIDTNYELGKPELKIQINREIANKHGVSASDIANVVNAALSSDIAISQYEEFGQQFDITLRIADSVRDTINSLKQLKVRAKSGELLFLDGLITFEESLGAASINRLDRQRQITITADLDGIVLGDAVSFTEENLKEILPDSISYQFFGMAKEMKKTGEAFMLAIALAVILMYLILAALYESLVQPVIIMVALPLSFIGVFIALYTTGLSFNLFTMIGIMLLLGMVGKNAVLLVDFANRAVKEGESYDNALTHAGEKRLRPILMTTMAMVGAMLPIAFGTGAGHESNAPMATAVIGGLLSSMILTLLIVPAMYRILAPFDNWLRKFYEVGEVK